VRGFFAKPRAMVPERESHPAEVRNVRAFSHPPGLDCDAATGVSSSALEPIDLRVCRL
jgi:hypothetical protein